jgi:hypothetical protein
VATPAGISGAVLLPFQVSVLGTPSPAVTPTNLLYNVVSTPGALYRYRRQLSDAHATPRGWPRHQESALRVVAPDPGLCGNFRHRHRRESVLVD